MTTTGIGVYLCPDLSEEDEAWAVRAAETIVPEALVDLFVAFLNFGDEPIGSSTVKERAVC